MSDPYKPFHAGVRPPVLCATCSDWGWVGTPQGYIFCACAAGARSRQELGDDWLSKLNEAQQPKRPPRILQARPPETPLKPITEEEVRRALAEHRARKPE